MRSRKYTASSSYPSTNLQPNLTFSSKKSDQIAKFSIANGGEKDMERQRTKGNEKDEKKWYLVYIILWDDIAVE